MFLSRLWSLYWKLLPMREFFFRKEQLPFVAVALIAAESWDRLSSPPGRRELSCCCFSLKSSPSYDHLGSRTTQFCESSAKKSFCRTTRTKVSKTAKVQIPPFFLIYLSSSTDAVVFRKPAYQSENCVRNNITSQWAFSLLSFEEHAGNKNKFLDKKKISFWIGNFNAPFAYEAWFRKPFSTSEVIFLKKVPFVNITGATFRLETFLS